MKRVDIVAIKRSDPDQMETLVCALGIVDGKVQVIEDFDHSEGYARDALGSPVYLKGEVIKHTEDPEKFLDCLYTNYRGTYSWAEPSFTDNDANYDENGKFIKNLTEIAPNLTEAEESISLPDGLTFAFDPENEILTEVAPNLTKGNSTLLHGHKNSISGLSDSQNLAEIVPNLTFSSSLPQGLTLGFCPTGPGGGIDNSCGRGESGGGTKTTIQGAAKKLAKLGYKLSAPKSKLVNGKFKTSYTLKDKKGHTRTVTPAQIKDILKGKGGGLSESARSEPTTPPPPGKDYTPDITSDPNSDGVADHARVGVGAFDIPDKIPLLPNLTPEERHVEQEFAEAYEHDPEGTVTAFSDAVIAASEASGMPPTFETDAAKELHPGWRGDMQSKEENLAFRATMNTPLHQTANVVAKAAFVQYLDTLKPGNEIMVTNGGCGAGKGHALNPKNGVTAALDMAARSQVVWDSAGDQNSTENPWIQQEAEARGLKVNYLFVAADPKVRWADDEIGVVSRAEKKGRMVDAEVFVDSYIQGAKNFDAFFESNRGNPNANFHMVDADGKDAALKDIASPPDYLKAADRQELIAFSIKSIEERDVSGHIKSGAVAGQRIWGKDK